ncbi:caveolin-3-like [Physella acuta]|uniref:caveolin-3-like n=1 Tax=Physella acuta TaxID=109671 RepID=UPI0027DB1918|nr:caveolin-3-like [Physella acuta]
MGVELDMVNRDPNGLNDHVRVLFDEVIAEPDGAHSINCVWTCAYRCFECCKGCCYKLLTLLCGCPLAMCWGCQFGCITFSHIWHITPCMRMFMINCGCLQKFYGTCLQCYLQPLCEAFSFLFSNIRVSNVSG